MSKPGEFSPATVQLIWDRDRGCCVVCGRGLRRERRAEPFDGWSVMHRESRGAGGVKRNSDRPHLTRAANGALGCGTGTTGCHAKVEAGDFPGLGYKVSRLGKDRPADVPMLHALFGWVRLDDAGGWETAA